MIEGLINLLIVAHVLYKTVVRFHMMFNFENHCVNAFSERRFLYTRSLGIQNKAFRK